MKTKYLLIAMAVFVLIIVTLFLLPAPNPKNINIKKTDIEKGEGDKVTEDTTVLFHYAAYLEDGTEFENTRDYGEAQEIKVSEIFPEGLQEGVIGMRAGGIREIYVPYQKAYGVMGGYPFIPPRANIIYELELLEIIVVRELEFEDISVGKGEEIDKDSTVLVNMIEKTEEGEELTNTYTNDKPIEISLSHELEGVKEGMKGMKVGGKREIFVPYQKAYGSMEVDPFVPARSHIIYEIEVIDIIEPSGITTENITEGDGKKVSPTDTVQVHYRGTLVDGTQFDSSYERDTPFEFTLNAGQVIEGWDLALEGMKVGEKNIVTIPYYLAYGSTGRSPTIPPRATLIFEIELIQIKE